jgi:hypothetical protein
VVASESLAGEVQWFSVPLGIAVLAVSGIGRAARREQGLSPVTTELVALEYLGMAFVVGDALLETVTTSPARGLFALALGIGLLSGGP